MADRKVHLVESKSFSTDVIREDLRLTGKERFRKIEHPIHQWRMSLDGCFTCLSSGPGRCGIPTACPTFPTNIKQNINSFMVGINYRFGASSYTNY